MKATARIFLPLLIAAFFLGCKTYTPVGVAEPSEQETVLLVGRVVYDFSEHPETMLGSRMTDFFPTGSYTENIHLLFANRDTKEEYLATSVDETGLFFVRVPGDIELNLMSIGIYSKEINRYVHEIKAYRFVPAKKVSRPDPKDQLALRVFEVGADQVYNLGTLHCFQFFPVHENIDQLQETAVVEALFAEKYPSNQWHLLPWSYKDLGSFFRMPIVE